MAFHDPQTNDRCRILRQITLLTAVAVVKALQVVTDKNFSIKWPNDIMLDGKKVCGILAEMALAADGNIEYAVVGIGININMSSEDFGAQLTATATSLYLQRASNTSMNKSSRRFWMNSICFTLTGTAAVLL